MHDHSSVTPQALAYLRLTSPTRDEWIPFAEDVLGARASTADGEVQLQTDDSPWRVAITAGGTNAIDAVGWMYSDEGAWSRAIEHLRALGVDVVSGSADLCAHRQCMGIASVVDPAGITHELCWGRTRTVTQLFVPGHGISRFLDGIGHVVVLTDRAADAKDFLLTGLQLGLSDFRRGAWFLRCNHRHHSIAYADSSETRMHHFMLEVGELDDVGRAFDRANSRHMVARELGRHSNDHMFSFYAKAPGGVELEYGWGGRRMDSGWIAHEIDGGDIWGHQVRAETSEAR